MIRFQYLQFSLCVLFLCFCGCPSNGNIGWVEGVVKLDGVPVGNATVIFHPASDARESVGTTDENGYYELRYTRNVDGAVVGQHKVTISSEVTAGGYGVEDKVEAQAETIPKKYRDPKKTELTETVESGSNTINFDLTSDK